MPARGLEHLALDALVVSPVAVGGGHVGTEHGRLPVPAPAVAELLRGFPSYGGPVDLELCTPTGAALLVANATGTGRAAGDGHDRDRSRCRRPRPGGAHERAAAAGRGLDSSTTGHGSTTGGPLLLETNVDDLDPRLWPAAIAALLAAGASDAWLTPILMKKGRPAHTLSVLVAADRAAAVRREVYRHTTHRAARACRSASARSTASW